VSATNVQTDEPVLGGKGTLQLLLKECLVLLPLNFLSKDGLSEALDSAIGLFEVRLRKLVVGLYFPSLIMQHLQLCHVGLLKTEHLIDEAALKSLECLLERSFKDCEVTEDTLFEVALWQLRHPLKVCRELELLLSLLHLPLVVLSLL
jgi:hypothetical protein